MSALSSGLRQPGIFINLALVVVVFVLLTPRAYSAPVHESESTQIAEYDGGSSGCYYNFQHYQEGARIITNEPCLNCTCHNRMLMCYLRVCPFTKGIGQDCMVEKRPDQCCPIITCPEVPVQLLTSTTSPKTTSSSSSISSGSITGDALTSTELGFPDTYGCNINDRFLADGAQLPIDSNNPCELCYCIRNKTTCLMQQCTLAVSGCKPIYQPGICCPVKYNCDYDEDYETTAGTTPGLIITSTTESTPFTTPPQCHYKDKLYEDGELIYMLQPCQHCYCLHGKIVCAVQECGKPMESHGKNCTAQPPPDGECCPTTYQCEDDLGFVPTEIPEMVEKKDSTEQSASVQSETFPGSDNSIPGEIPQHVSTTDESRTILPIGNEVPESESTKLPTTESHISEKHNITSQIEIEKSAEIEETVSHDESSLKSTTNDNLSENLSGNENTRAPEVFDVYTTSKPSSEIPSLIKDEEISNIGEEKISMISTVATKEFSEPTFKNDFNTITSTEKHEILPELDLVSVATTEKQITNLETSSTESYISTIKSTDYVHQPDIAIEKSSESSSPISEVMTQESFGKGTSESTIYSSSMESEKETDNVQQDITTEYNNLDLFESSSEKTETEQTTLNKEILVGDKNDETTINSEILVTDTSGEFGILNETKSPAKSDTSKEVTSEIPVGNDKHEENTETTEPISFEYSTVISNQDKYSTLDSNSTSENIDSTTTANDSESTFDKNNATNSIPAVSSTEVITSVTTESSNEVIEEKVSPTFDESFVKSEDDSQSETSTEMPYSEIPVSYDEKIPQQGPTGIPIPDRVPEHKAEDKDAVTDSEVTKEYFVTSSGMPHNIDNLKTDLEYATTYLPPLSSSTENNRDSSTPYYEDLPKEEPEVDTTEITVTPKASVSKPETALNEILKDNKESTDKSTAHSENEESNKDFTPTELSTKEAITEKINIDLPEDISKIDDSDIHSKVSEKATEQSLIFESTTLSVISEQPITEKIGIATSETSIFGKVTDDLTKQNPTESSIANSVISSESQSELGKENTITESPNVDTTTIRIKEATTNKIFTESLEESENISTPKSINVEYVTTVKETSAEFTENFSSLDTSTEYANDNQYSTETSMVTSAEISDGFKKETGSEENTEPSIAVETKSTEKEATETPLASSNSTRYSPIKPASSEAPSLETKIEAEDSLKEISTMQPELQTVSDETNKIKNDTSQLPETISTDSIDQHVAESPINELTSVVDDTKTSTEQAVSTESVLNKEHESSHSTEPDVLKNQTPKIETEIVPERRPALGIPGEGNCLVDGQSYANQSAIPPSNPCQLSCRCFSSIVRCELVKCSPPPSDLPNCTPVFSKPESCCPMYTCDSTPSAELEVDNQKSDQHSTVSDKIQSQTTEKVSVEESTQIKELLTVSDVTINAQPEVVPDTTTKHTEQDSIILTSPGQGEMESSSKTKENTPISKEPETYLKVDESKPHLPANEKENAVDTSNNENTDSIFVTTTENAIHVSSTDETVVSYSSESPSKSQNGTLIQQQTTKSEETVSEGGVSEDLSMSVGIVSTTKASSVDDINLAQTSTASSAQTEIQISNTEKSASTIKNDEKGTPGMVTLVYTSEAVETTEKSAISGDDLTYLSTSVPSLSTSEQKLTEKEISKPEVIHTTSESNYLQSETQKPLIESTPTNQDISIPQEIQPESVTEAADKQLISTTIETVITTNEVIKSHDFSTEKIVNLDPTLTTEPSKISAVTEDNQKVTMTDIKPNEESSISSTDRIEGGIASNGISEKPLEETTVLYVDNSEPTSPSLKETSSFSTDTIQTSDIPLISSQSISQKPEFADEGSKGTSIESILEENKTESVIGIDVEKSTEKSQETSSEISTEISEGLPTSNQENKYSSTTEIFDIKLNPTESFTDNKNKPDDYITESTVETKISDGTESSSILEDKYEDINSTGPKEKEPILPTEKPSSTSYEEKKSEATSETSFENDVTMSTVTQNKTKNELEENSSSVPASTSEIAMDVSINSSTESSQEELTFVGSSSETVPTDNEQTQSSTDASYSDVSLMTSEKPDDEGQSLSSNISTQTSDSSVTDVPTTVPSNLQESNFKGPVSQDELTSTESSELIPAEDDQYHTDAHHTEEPIPLNPHESENQSSTEHNSTPSSPLTRPKFPDQQVPETDDEHIFPPDGADIKNQNEDSDTEDYDDQAVYGPGTCRYGGKIYMSAQQIPRDDPCDFCFCFRSDIICLQQSCPPPIPGCHEEPIGGFCCPRYECPVSMASSVNVTTTTTTTTTTLPPHFLSHPYKEHPPRGGCQIGNRSYRVGQHIDSKSGPCMSCTCGGDGKMKCEPKACSASPMLKQMIAHAAARKRRR